MNPDLVRQHAIIVYSGAKNVTLRDVVGREEYRQSWAQNPNAINYYLEGGDYAFAVIGSILVFSVFVLIFFGYVWNPLD
jgi:precorrin-2 methylase